MDLLKPKWQSESTVCCVVHTIKMGDVEDPDVMVADPIYKWQQTDAGKWVMQNSMPEPSWHRHMNTWSYGYEYTIRAYLTPEKCTYWRLKYE